MDQIQTVSMADIAQQLGVSASTVSRALRGDGRIGAGTRAHIKSTAQKMGYTPNPLVSALMANRRRRGSSGEVDVVALVTNYGGREAWRAKDVCRWEFDGIQERAAQLGFRVEEFPLREYRGDAARLAATLRARGIRGVLLGFSREEGSPAPFGMEGFAVAGLSAYFTGAQVDRANFHGFYNVQLALEKMWALGCRRPALVVPELNNRISNNLWSGAFLDWQRRIPPRDRCEIYTPEDGAGAAEFDAWLDGNEPDSLLVYKVQLRGHLAQRGLRVPEDIGLAYLYRTAAEMRGTAGIDGNLSAVGAAAFDLVVEKLNANITGPSEHPKEVLIKGTWHNGATLRMRAPRPRSRPARSPAKVLSLVAP